MLKRFFLLCALALALATCARATDITIPELTLPNFYAPNLGANTTGSATVTNGSATVTSSAAFPVRLVGLGGYKILLGGVEYEVLSTESTSSLTLRSNYIGANGAAAFTVYPVVVLQIYSDLPYVPLGKSYIVQSGAAGTQVFYKRIACTVRTISGVQSVTIPAITLDAISDVANNAEKGARLSAYFYRLEGTQIRAYDGFQSFTLTSAPTTQEWKDIRYYNNRTARAFVDNSTYTAEQINALVQFRGTIAGLYRRIGMIGSSGASVENSALLQDSGGNVAAEQGFAVGGALSTGGAATIGGSASLARTSYIRGDGAKTIDLLASKVDADQYASLQAAASGLGASRILQISSAQTLGSAATIARGKVADVYNVITFGSNKLKILGRINAGAYQIFDTAGTGGVEFGDNATSTPSEQKDFYLEWWGGIANDASAGAVAANNTAYAKFQAAVSGRAGAVLRGLGEYYISQSIVIPYPSGTYLNDGSGLRIEGQLSGQNGFTNKVGFVWVGASTGSIVKVQARDVVLRGISVRTASGYNAKKGVDIDTATAGQVITHDLLDNVSITTDNNARRTALVVKTVASSTSLQIGAIAGTWASSGGTTITGTSGAALTEVFAGERINFNGSVYYVRYASNDNTIYLMDANHNDVSVGTATGKTITHFQQFDSGMIDQWVVLGNGGGASFENPFYAQITGYVSATQVTLSTAATDNSVCWGVVSPIFAAVSIGETATVNCDLHEIKNSTVNDVAVAIHIPSTSGQVKAVAVENCDFGIVGIHIWQNTGSFNVRKTAFARAYISCVVVRSPTDGGLSIDGAQCEETPVFWKEIAGTSAAFGVKIANVRMGANVINSDGVVLDFKSVGTFIVENFCIDSQYAERATIKYQPPSARGGLVVNGGAFPTTNPYRSVSSGVCTTGNSVLGLRSDGTRYALLDRNCSSGGAAITSRYAVNSNSGGIQEAYDSLPSGGAFTAQYGGKVILDDDITISAASTISVATGKPFVLDLNGHKITFTHNSGTGLTIQGNNSSRVEVRDGTIHYGGSATGITGLKIKDRAISLVQNISFSGFTGTNNLPFHGDNMQDGALVDCNFMYNYLGAKISYSSNNFLIDRCRFQGDFSTTQGLQLLLEDVGGVTVSNSLFQALKTNTAIKIAKNVDANPHHGITLRNNHFEAVTQTGNYAAGHANDKMVVIDTGGQNFTGLLFEGNGFNCAPGATAAVYRTGGASLALESTNNIYNGATPFSGISITEVLSKNDAGQASTVSNVEIKPYGIIFGASSSARQFLMTGGYPGQNDGYWQLLDMGDSSKAVLGMNQYGFYVGSGRDLYGTTGGAGFSTTTFVLSARNGNARFDGFLAMAGTPQTLTGAGAVSVDSDTTLLVTTGANALTLADGATGQIKTIVMKTDGGDGTLTPTHALGFSTITFTAVGQSVVLKFVDSKWIVIGSFGVTIA